MNMQIWSEIKDVVTTIALLEYELEKEEIRTNREKLAEKQNRLLELRKEYRELNSRLYDD